jgi:hypothetical protein
MNPTSNNSSKKEPIIPFMTIAEFCDRLDMNRNFYLRRLKQMGEKSPGRRLSLEDQKRLCKLFGVPFWGNRDEKW